MVVPFDAVATARAVRGGRACIARVSQFGIKVELPQSQRALQTRYGLGSQPKLRATRAHQTGYTVLRVAGLGVDRRRHTARIIAVKSPARVHK